MAGTIRVGLIVPRLGNSFNRRLNIDMLPPRASASEVRVRGKDNVVQVKLNAKCKLSGGVRVSVSSGA